MITIYITLFIVGLFYGSRSAVRTFRSEMRNDNKVGLMVAFIGILVFICATKIMPGS